MDINLGCSSSVPLMNYHSLLLPLTCLQLLLRHSLIFLLSPLLLLPLFLLVLLFLFLPLLLPLLALFLLILLLHPLAFLRPYLCLTHLHLVFNIPLPKSYLLQQIYHLTPLLFDNTNHLGSTQTWTVMKPF